MQGYDPSAYPPFAVTVDLVVLTVRDDELCVLLVERGHAPFAGSLALPGGFVLVEEDLETAAYRELTEESGLDRDDVFLEQLGTYGTPDRDPRMRVVSIAWLAIGPVSRVPVGGGDAAAARWVPVSDALQPGALAFDHQQILTDGVERARAKLEYTDLGTLFLGEEFTIAELRRLYETIWGIPRLDPGNFQRKFATRSSAPDESSVLVPTGHQREDSRSGRAAESYRRRSHSLAPAPLDPPFRRPEVPADEYVPAGTTVHSKSELVALLTRWAQQSAALTIGDIGSFGGKAWITIQLGDHQAVLNSDTKRSAVLACLAYAAEHPADDTWHVVANSRGTINRVVYRTDTPLPGWYCYTPKPWSAPGML